MEKIVEIIEEMQEEINSIEFKFDYRVRVEDFSCTKNLLQFPVIVKFVLSSIKSTLDCEIEHYFGIDSSLGGKVSGAAISKARSKVKSEAFEHLLLKESELIGREKTMKGYEILGVDGMDFELPRTAELMEKYAVEKSGYPMASTIAIFDVLNKVFVRGSFSQSPANERAEAQSLIKLMDEDRAQIFLFDRGFPSLSLIQELIESEKKFLMRCSKSFLREVDEFRLSDETDKVISIDYTARRAQTSRVSGVTLPFHFVLRCVKIELSSGETEILITNLSQEEFSTDEMGELYFMRWGIETGFNHLKNAVHLETFLGKTENSIKQEFFASLIIYNLCLAMVSQAQVIADVSASKKNFNTK